MVAIFKRAAHRRRHQGEGARARRRSRRHRGRRGAGAPSAGSAQSAAALRHHRARRRARDRAGQAPHRAASRASRRGTTGTNTTTTSWRSSRLEEASLELVYWLEDNGYPAIIVPPTHSRSLDLQDGEPQQASCRPCCRCRMRRSRPGLGTLGLNLQLLTPEYGPRVVLTAVLCSVDVDCDTRMEQALCLGPSCARCLKVCPGDAVGHWSRDWEACDPHRSPHGFRAALRSRRRASSRRRRRGAEGAGALGGQLQSLAEHSARRRRDHRLPQMRRRLPGRRRLSGDAERRARRDPGIDAREGSSAPPPWSRTKNAGRMPETYAAQQRWIGNVAAAEPDTMLAAAEIARRDRAPSRRSASGTRSRRRSARRSTPASSTTSIPTGSTTRTSGARSRSSPRTCCAASPTRDFYEKFCVKPDDGIAEFWRSGGATGAPLFYPRSFTDIRYAMIGFCAHLSMRRLHAGRTRACVVSARHPSGRPDAGALRDRRRHRGELGRLRHHDAVGDADRADRPAQADDLDGHEQLRPASRQSGRGARARSRGKLGQDDPLLGRAAVRGQARRSSRANGARRCATRSA